MNQIERIARVEAVVESHAEVIANNAQALTSLRDHMDRGFVEARNHTDKCFGEALKHTDKCFAEARNHTDKCFAEARAHTDRSIAELRKDMTKLTHWMVGLMFSQAIAVIGIIGLLVKAS